MFVQPTPCNSRSQKAQRHPQKLLWLFSSLLLAGCADTSAPLPSTQTITATHTANQVNIKVHPQGEYATVDNKPIAQTIHLLATTTGDQSDALIAQIESHSGDYAPPVLFMLSVVLYQHRFLDDATFWYNAARVRASFDAARCADVTARGAVMKLMSQVPVPLRRAQFDDTEKLHDIAQRAVKWDETTPYHYDYRWINLSGMNAVASGMGNTDVLNRPMTLPQEQWVALATRVRLEYLASMEIAIQMHNKQKGGAQGGVKPLVS